MNKWLQPTMTLRFIERSNGDQVVRVLQQQWIDTFTDEVEWHDVPLEEEV